MNDLNNVLLEGRLTRDPELKHTPGGTTVCNFSIATNKSYKQNNEWKTKVSYFDITTFGKQAEICNEYLKKGRGVRVVGELSQDRWEQEGKQRSKVCIIGNHIEFAPQKKQDQQSTPSITVAEDDKPPF